MKKFLALLLVLASAGLASGAFVDFFCNQSAGANINGGSSTATSVYTSTNGNWSTVTNNFTPTDGTNPSTASPACTVGDYASIYVDGATVAVYIAKITVVTNATNGLITMSSTLKAGAAPSTSATGRSIKCGGVWKGPNAASGFPLTLASLTNLAASTDKLAINLKNNASYVMTASITETGSQNVLVQGYSSSVRDGGKATIDGGTSGTSYNVLTTSAAAGWSHVDLIFINNGASGSAAGVATQSVSVSFARCVFAAMRGSGASSSTGAIFIECEFYGNNLGNTASLGGVDGIGTFVRCVSHDNTGSNSAGFFMNVSSGVATYVHCIADTNGGVGFSVSNSGGAVQMYNCDSYNNTSDGISTVSVKGLFWAENCNLIKNGGWGINFATANTAEHFVYNCGFGAGTQVNASGTTTGIYSGQEIGSITYASNVTPWVDPANGDFRVNLAAANFTGRGAFTETAASYAGTVGYPDVGAAQSKTGSSGTFTKEVSGGYGY